MSDLIEVSGKTVRFSFHPGQLRAWESTKRIVAVCAGTQGGKTAFCPIWLWKEMRDRGPGSYGFISPTFSLLKKKALPEFLNLFRRLFRFGEYNATDKIFTFSPDGARRLFGYVPEIETQVFFGYAENPDSLESSTLKAVVCDEAGQKQFKGDSYFALRRRLSIHQGRMLIATTPYSNAGWLRTEIHDKWAAGDDTIDFIRFASTMNPAFPLAEYEWAHKNLPRWRAAMMYDGEFQRPAGLIYDCFDAPVHKIQRFPIPERWRRFVGLDFGGVNTAATFWAECPQTKHWYCYREYKAGGRTAREHATAIREGEPMALTCYGGSKSEGQWRDEFRAAGLVVREPDQVDVEVGINRVYGAIKRGEIYVFEDLPGLIEEIETYSRKVNDKGEPTEEIDAKNSFHHLDSARYVISPNKKEAPAFAITLPGPGDGLKAMEAPRGVF